VTQPLVLAIEPDLRQAAIVKRIVREKALADIAVVETRDAAIEAMRTTMPDVLLISALLSPRDEDELMAHLRTLDNAGHLQTHTIPQLASSLEVPGGRASRGLLSAFRRKKEPEPINSGCDPDMFAEEIRVFIQRAAAKRRERAESGEAAPDMRVEARSQSHANAPAQLPEPAGPAASSWSSPFEWKPSATAHPAKTEEKPAAAERVAAPVEVEAAVLAIEPIVVEAVVEPFQPEPVKAIEAVQAVEEVAPIAVVEPVVKAVVEAVTAVEPAPRAAAPIEIVADPELIAELPHIEVVSLEPVATEAPGAVAVRVVEETEIALEPLTHKSAQPASEWAPPSPAAATAKTTDRLGPLAGWARKEPTKKAKPEAVTADDVRALISSLAVPPAVASVTYARGCRIRRVRVPAAGHDSSESFGTVILSRRILAEQRERRPSV